jgi:chromosome segregation ATPase
VNWHCSWLNLLDFNSLCSTLYFYLVRATYYVTFFPFYRLLEYAVSEMFKLRRTNADVSQELSELKERNHSLTESHQSLEAAVSLSNRQVVQMGRSNSALVAEVAAQTKKATILEKKMKQLQQQHAEELKSVRESLQEEISARDMENAKLLKSTEKLMLAHKKDMRRAEKLQKRVEEKSSFEVEHLRKELRDTQEAHHDYLNKLMDVVENAHMAREAEEARITEEFHARLYQKDHEIAKLRSELSALKKAATHRSKGYNI